ncbi:MAG: hypothetical protein LUF83_12880 [Alistipes sp.]|nr:hypothetical protein [Alistipes sp.]
MKKIVLAGMLIFILPKLSLGQSFNQPSPESAGLIRSVNLQVNKSMGIVGTYVPIYSIDYSSFQVPISLSYNSSGHKVTDRASWTGLGWNLSAGGRITRVIMDNDDLKGGYPLGQGILADGPMSDWWYKGHFVDSRVDKCIKTEATATSGEPPIYHKCLEHQYFDSEPDLFYYEIPGRSGMFVLDKDGKAWPIPYSGIKIKLEYASCFTIEDENGYYYEFNLKEYTKTTMHSENAHEGVDASIFEQIIDPFDVLFNKNKAISENNVSTWHLTKMTNHLGAEINFSYVQGNELKYWNRFYSRWDNEKIRNLSTYVQNTPYYLSSITWKTGHLDFLSAVNASGNRQLNEIRIYNPGYVKSVNFAYTYYRRGDFVSRLMLQNVSESNGENSQLINRFEYNDSVLLPDGDSKDFDHWGYYNGANNTSWLPSEGASRQPSFQYTEASILKKVYYNSGGHVEYEYEANKDKKNVAKGGVRIKSIKKYDAGILMEATSYGYQDGCDIGKDITYDNMIYEHKYVTSHPKFNIYDIGGSNIYYGIVTEMRPNGSSIVSKYTTFSDQNDVQSVFSVLGTELVPNTTNGMLPNSSRFWRRGLLLEERNLDNRKVEMSKTVYTYSYDLKMKINSYNMLSYYGYDYVTICDWLSETVNVSSVTRTGKKELNRTLNYTYDPETNLPVCEEISLADGQKRKVITKYPGSYSNVENSFMDTLIKYRLFGVPIERIAYENECVTGAELYEYSLFGPDSPFRKKFPALSAKKILKLNKPISDFRESSIDSNGNLICDSRYVTVESDFDYNDVGNLLTKQVEGRTQSTVYDYLTFSPIASVTNAANTNPLSTMDYRRTCQVFHTGFEMTGDAVNCANAKTGIKVYDKEYMIPIRRFIPGDYLLTYWKSTDNGVTWNREKQIISITESSNSYTVGGISMLIDDICLYPVDAAITTCTWSPEGLKTSETDQNGAVVYYDYDWLGRLLRVRDNDRNVLEEYSYHVKQ